MWVGPETCKLAVIAHRMPFQNAPFEGNAGKMFKDTMTHTGIGVEKVAFGDDVDMDLEDAIQGVKAQFVILAGDRVLQWFRPDLYVRQCHGRPMLMFPDFPDRTPILFPVFHPEAYWRFPRWRALLAVELKSLMELAHNRNRWQDFCPQSCVKCRGLPHRTDPMGVVYCEVH